MNPVLSDFHSSNTVHDEIELFVSGCFTGLELRSSTTCFILCSKPHAELSEFHQELKTLLMELSGTLLECFRDENVIGEFAHERFADSFADRDSKVSDIDRIQDKCSAAQMWDMIYFITPILGEFYPDHNLISRLNELAYGKRDYSAKDLNCYYRTEVYANTIFWLYTRWWVPACVTVRLSQVGFTIFKPTRYIFAKYFDRKGAISVAVQLSENIPRFKRFAAKVIRSSLKGHTLLEKLDRYQKAHDDLIRRQASSIVLNQSMSTTTYHFLIIIPVVLTVCIPVAIKFVGIESINTNIDNLIGVNAFGKAAKAGFSFVNGIVDSLNSSSNEHKKALVDNAPALLQP